MKKKWIVGIVVWEVTAYAPDEEEYFVPKNAEYAVAKFNTFKHADEFGEALAHEARMRAKQEGLEVLE